MSSVHYCTRVDPVPHAEFLLWSKPGPGKYNSKFVSRALHPNPKANLIKKKKKKKLFRIRLILIRIRIQLWIRLKYQKIPTK